MFSIELCADTLTFQAGGLIEGFVHCNFKDKNPSFTNNKILTLEFSGKESTKWEVPDENSVNGEEYLEYGGNNDIVFISRVMHRFPETAKTQSSS